MIKEVKEVVTGSREIARAMGVTLKYLFKKRKVPYKHQVTRPAGSFHKSSNAPHISDSIVIHYKSIHTHTPEEN